MRFDAAQWPGGRGGGVKIHLLLLDEFSHKKKRGQ